MSEQPKALQLIQDQFHVPVLLYALATGASASGVALFLQWIVYDDWLHEAGPLRLAGAVLAGLVMGVLVFRSERHARERRREMLERLQAIRWMNDRIRNSLQAIECITYASAPETTLDVKNSVDVIECILNDFLAVHHPQKGLGKKVDSNARADFQIR